MEGVVLGNDDGSEDGVLLGTTLGMLVGIVDGIKVGVSLGISLGAYPAPDPPPHTQHASSEFFPLDHMLLNLVQKNILGIWTHPCPNSVSHIYVGSSIH